MRRLEKRDWLLLILREKPLDVLRLMKGLFLIWNRSGRQIDGFYRFVPYKYGPYSSELYNELELAKRDGLVNSSVTRWAPYSLTPKGLAEAANAGKKTDSGILALIQSIAIEVISVNFYGLLRRVYLEAPDFAAKSVMANQFSFLKGMGSVLDLSGESFMAPLRETLPPCDNPYEADMNALASDWIAVGQDIGAAAKQFENEK